MINTDFLPIIIELVDHFTILLIVLTYTKESHQISYPVKLGKLSQQEGGGLEEHGGLPTSYFCYYNL